MLSRETQAASAEHMAREHILGDGAQVGRCASQDEPDETMVVQGGDDQLPEFWRQSLGRHRNNRGVRSDTGRNKRLGAARSHGGSTLVLRCQECARDELFHASGEASAVSCLVGDGVTWSVPSAATVLGAARQSRRWRWHTSIWTCGRESGAGLEATPQDSRLRGATSVQ
jgi:hypothetical protein